MPFSDNAPIAARGGQRRQFKSRLLSRRELPPHDGSRGARSGFLRRLPLATHQSRFGRLPAVLCPPVSRVKTIRELLILLRYREQLVPNPVAWLGPRHQVKSIGFANAPPVPWQARTRGIPFPQPHAITFKVLARQSECRLFFNISQIVRILGAASV